MNKKIKLPKPTTATAQPENVRPVCPNCQQWQNNDKIGQDEEGNDFVYADCFNDCASRDLAPKHKLTAADAPEAPQTFGLPQTGKPILDALLNASESFADPTPSKGESAHTPGPWKVWQANDGTLDVCHESEGLRSRIARLHIECLCEKHGGNIEANARLIAAAPETAAERDRLKDELHNAMLEYQKTGGGALSIPEAIRELISQRDALLAACKAVHAALSQSVAFSDESENDLKSLDILRGDCFTARQQIQAAIASVESEGK